MLKNLFQSMALLITLSSCQSQKTQNTPPPQKLQDVHKFNFAAMGSPWILQYSVPEGQSVIHSQIEVIFQKTLKVYEETFSDWSEDSELRRLEKEGLSSPQHLKASPLFIEGLEIAKEAYSVSEGNFDLSVGAVIWKERTRPAGMLTLDVRPDLNKFRFGVNPARLSFGGLAKGMCLGELAEKLLKNGILDFKIEAGGGNSVYSGVYDSQLDATEKLTTQKTCESIKFISRSHSEQNQKQHIFNPKEINKAVQGSVVLTCVSCRDAELKRFGGLNDAFSTALLVSSFKLPKDMSCFLKKQN